MRPIFDETSASEPARAPSCRRDRPTLGGLAALWVVLSVVCAGPASAQATGGRGGLGGAGGSGGPGSAGGPAGGLGPSGGGLTASPNATSPADPGTGPLGAAPPGLGAVPDATQVPGSDRTRAKPLEQVLRGVLDAVPGTLLDVEVVHDVQRRPRYRVKILSPDDAVRSVFVDPGSGSIVSVE